MIVGRIDCLRVASGLDDTRILADQFSTRVVNEDRLFRAGDLLHTLPIAIVEMLADYLLSMNLSTNVRLTAPMGQPFVCASLRDLPSLPS